MLKKIIPVFILCFSASLFGAEIPLIENDGRGKPLDVVVPDSVEVIRFRPDPKSPSNSKTKSNFSLFKRKKEPKEILIPQSDRAEIVRIWDAERKIVLQHVSNSETPQKILISPSGDRFLSPVESPLGQVLRDSNTGRAIRHTEPNENYIGFATDANHLFALKTNPNHQQSLFRIYDAANGSISHEVSTDGGPELLMSPSGTHFLAAGGKEYDGGLYLWEVSTGKRLHRMQGVSGTAVANSLWSPDGKYFVKPMSGHVGVWDIPTGDNLKYYKIPFDVNAACFSPEGNRIVLAKGLLTIIFPSPQVCAILIAIPTGETIQQFKTQESYIDQVMYSYDGSHLMAKGRDLKGLYVWDISK